MEGRSSYMRSPSKGNGRVSGTAADDGVIGIPQPLLKASSVETSRVFAPNASIVLVGIRGSGKTSLGYIAARSLGWRLIEADDEFERQTGKSRAKFLKENQNSAEEYRMQERQVLESMLVRNQTDAVIVCGVGSIEAYGQTLLRKYALNHPVIHIIRETEHVRNWLRIPGESNLMQRLEDSDRKHRICSNFEFYNLFDGGSQVGNKQVDVQLLQGTVSGGQSSKHVGILQQTQRDFVGFINLIMGVGNPTLQELQSKISAAPEDNVYTYALTVNFTDLVDGDLSFSQLESGADAIELVIKGSDLTSKSLSADSRWITKLSEVFAVLRRQVAAPIIVHVDKTTLTAGPWVEMSPDEIYGELLLLASRFAAEFVTVDIDFSDAAINRFCKSKGLTRVIANSFSHETFQNENLIHERYKKALLLPCEIIRIVQFASCDEDNLAIRKLHKLNSQKSKGQRRHLIAYNFGRLGRASMCSNLIMTSVTHPLLRERAGVDERALLTMAEVSRITYDLGMLDPMHFCVIGASVHYSLSPAMHHAAYTACGLPHTFKIRQSSNLKELDNLFKDPTFGGAAISLPFKIETTKVLTSSSPEAEAIGAINTIIPIRDPTGGDESRSNPRILRSRAGPIVGWHGDNTDWIGLTTCITRNLTPANMIRPWTSSLVIGAGGMARAAVYALIRLEVPNIFIHNRTVANAEKIVAHFNKFAASIRSSGLATGRKRVTYQIRVLESTNDSWPIGFEQPTIIISCIPAHSIGGNPPADITLPQSWLKSVNGGVFVEVSLLNSNENIR